MLDFSLYLCYTIIVIKGAPVHTQGEKIMTTIKKLSAMPYAQAHVEFTAIGEINLFSYNTLVVSIDVNGWVQVFGLYSMTTRKHISAFAKEYAQPLDFHTLKKVYNDKMVINMHTGEVITLEEYEKGGDK